MIAETSRLLAALVLLLGYGGLCGWAWLRAHRARALPSGVAGRASGWQVVYASQSGAAAALAGQAAQALRAAVTEAPGQRRADVPCLPLDQLDPARLAVGGRYLFIVSTYGDGEAPDNGRRFARYLTDYRRYDLRKVDFAVLALGDRDYSDFCGFGRRLDAWLTACGARACFPRLEVDRLDPEALQSWRQRLASLCGADELGGEEGPGEGLGEQSEQSEPAAMPESLRTPEFHPWWLVSRTHLNPGSSGGGVYHLRLQPVAGEGGGVLPGQWQSGDLALIAPPSGGGRAREYSIASLPTDGGIELLVRRQQRPDGSPGEVSSWLGEGLPLGGVLRLALRPHAAFRLHDNLTRPAIFIGNGVGLAALRGHLSARIALGNHDHWLLFGERQQACDYHWRHALEEWQRQGALAHLDPVFSRDGSSVRYVQHRLLAEQQRLLAWLSRGSAIYLCGSRPMGEGVEAVLTQLLGESGLTELALSGHYRRDVF